MRRDLHTLLTLSAQITRRTNPSTPLSVLSCIHQSTSHKTRPLPPPISIPKVASAAAPTDHPTKGITHMFNTPFAFNGFQGQSFPGFQGFNGFNGWNNWNSFSNTPWSFNNWNSTPWNWNSNSFGGSFPWNQFFNGFQGQGFQGFNSFSPWSQSFTGWNQWSPFNAWNWFNTPWSFFGNQFGSQFNSPFGFNWWNNESAQSESGAPNFQGSPFGFNPFAGFNPSNTPANQAA